MNDFYVLEGADGVGHTSLAGAVMHLLITKNILVCTTSEPTHVLYYGKIIRDVLERRRPKVNDPLTFQMMYILDRAEHLRKVDENIRDVGGRAIVICERYIYSTIAYGVATHATSYEALLSMNAVFPRPRAAFFLVADLETMRKRMGLSGKEKDILEADSGVQEGVAGVYGKMASGGEDFPEVELIDASGTLEETADIVYRRIVVLSGL